MTQNDRLIAYLEAHDGGITQLEAFNTLGICRLSERIRELTRMGHSIIGTPERTPGGARVIRYRLQLAVQRPPQVEHGAGVFRRTEVIQRVTRLFDYP